MKDIVICSTSRSERQLQEPLIKRFGDKCEVLELPADFRKAYDLVLEYLAETKPKFAFCSFDRLEMMFVALAFWLNGVNVIQYHAGDYAGEGVFDDAVRDMITQISTFQFCNGKKSFERCKKLLQAANKPIDKCFEVGSMAIEGVKLDYSMVPYKKFDLVLYNVPNAALDLIDVELRQIENLLDKYTIWVYPSEDFGRDKVVAMIKKLEDEKVVFGCKTLPRNQFLALIKEADRVIGNSSSFKLELPFFRSDYVHIGLRNKDREAVEPGIGASEKMVEIVNDALKKGDL